MIEIRVKKVTIPDSLKDLDKTYKTLINDYLFRNLDIPRIVHYVRDNYVYKKLKRSTGKLGESMTPEKRKINQYASIYGFYFDSRIAPHADTQISEGIGIKTITAHGDGKLAIPVKGGPAYRVRSRLSPRDFGGTSGPNSAFLARGRKLFLKGSGTSGVPYFILKHQVQIPQRVYAGELLNRFQNELHRQVNSIAVKALGR